MSDNPNIQEKPTQPPKPESRPNEHGAISVEGFIKIWDPQTKKVLVEKRA